MTARVALLFLFALLDVPTREQVSSVVAGGRRFYFDGESGELLRICTSTAKVDPLPEWHPRRLLNFRKARGW